MAITMTPAGQLDSAFSEVEAARGDLKKKEHEEQVAQREDLRRGLVEGLTPAARLVGDPALAGVTPRVRRYSRACCPRRSV